VERVNAEGGEVQWRLTDVIGAEDGLGVECLSGSGAIASAYSKAFREVRVIHTVDPSAEERRCGSACCVRVWKVPSCPCNIPSTGMQGQSRARAVIATGLAQTTDLDAATHRWRAKPQSLSL